ncbi:hypothetical protein LTR37_014550 [Vermiconidia calcicola]|uniref:Uncharacterized protein n=1 Tax=Vermiconidia calcicola TaxID=1690605 RepID=A0ACC3MTC3_9PEZI|nr:hypothetical protein LTR37_014550 [Vermiconidia calcicola]
MFFDSYFEHNKDIGNVKPAISLARDSTKIDEYLDEYFKALLSLDLTQEVKVKCIGVWDTVGALGIPVNPLLQRLFPFLPSFVREYSWFDTRLDGHIENTFQALALDERRYPFSPTLWERRKGCPTNLKQVWFPGSHSNVGGSYADSGIANITLAWMMDQLSGNTANHPNGFVEHDWLKFDEEYIKYWEQNQHNWYEKHKQQAYRGWARGYIYDNIYFPTSLTGTQIRRPCRNHGTFCNTGKPDGERLLEDTQEHIHSSVRAHIDLGGQGTEPDWNKVFPNSFNFEPLIAWCWRYLTGRKPRPYQPQGQRHIKWVYEGSEACCANVMPEDKLGPFELELLEQDQEFTDQIRVSNNSRKWFKQRLPNQPPKRGHTV